MSNTSSPVPPAPESMILLVIATKQSGTFVKVSQKVSPYGYLVSTGDISPCLLDGEKPEKTRVDGWFHIKGTCPTSITKVVPGQVKTVRWDLSPGFAPSERMPATLPYTSSSLEDTPHSGVAECYMRVTEKLSDTTVEVPFQCYVIAERDTFEVVRSDFTLTYGLIDQLTIADPILLQERPCALDGRQSYNLIRQHVKTHINPEYAEITSDYDFCLTVEKRIALAEPEPFKRRVGTGRRAHDVTDYRRHRNVEVYKVAPPDRHTGKPYSGYPLVTPFVGTSHEDLKANIALYLDNLMKRINEPLCECKACGGKGVIVEPIKTP